MNEFDLGKMVMMLCEGWRMIMIVMTMAMAMTMALKNR